MLFCITANCRAQHVDIRVHFFHLAGCSDDLGWDVVHHQKIGFGLLDLLEDGEEIGCARRVDPA
jgi:hypothetical protein